MLMGDEKTRASTRDHRGLSARLVKRLEHFSIDLDLRCPAGRLLAVVGPSGAGKTRLLRCLAGLEQPDEGRILVDGECWLDTAARRQLPPQRRSAGLLFQEYGLFPHMTVRENVTFSAHPACDVDGLLETFGIAPLRSRKPAALSGGERQRAALCQAIARRPRLLLLDEPFSALDMENRFALRAELLRLKDAWDIPRALRDPRPGRRPGRGRRDPGPAGGPFRSVLARTSDRVVATRPGPSARPA
jgi:ABC-type molybdate transport system, ATPase component